MIKKILNTSFLLSFFIFIFIIGKYYISEKNIILINKQRSTTAFNKSIDIEKLPLLVNDTKNIIEYKDDLEEFNKKRKKRFWEKLISNANE